MITSDKINQMVERINDLVQLSRETSSFHQDAIKNAQVGDEITIYSRGALRRGRVTKATVKSVTVEYTTPGAVEVAKKLVPIYAQRDEPNEGARELAQAGIWQYFVHTTEKTVKRDHNGQPKRHPGFNCL